MKIEKNELTGVLTLLMCMKLFLAYPRHMLTFSGNASWIVGIYVTIVALAIFFITDKIYRTNKSILQIANEIGGRALRIPVGILLFLILMGNISHTLRVFPESVRIILLQNTPMVIIIIAMTIAIALGSQYGIISLSRITSFFLPIAAAIMIGFIILLFPHFLTKNIFPIFGYGLKEIFIDGLEGISLFSDIIALFILLPKTKGTPKKCGYKAILISGGAMTILLISLGLVYPNPVSKEFLTPVYQLTRLVSIGNFFSRVEAFFEFIWSIGMFIYAAIYVNIMSLVLKETFDLKHKTPLILPVLVLSTGVSYIPDSLIDFLSVFEGYMVYLYIGAIAVPILFGILERIRNQKEEQ